MQMQVQTQSSAHECSLDGLFAKQEIDQHQHQPDTHILQEAAAGLSFHPELIATHMALAGHSHVHHHNNTLLQVPAHVTLYPVMGEGNSSTV